ncbi:MAG: hypothetical protein ABR928_06055 [Terracidiphilus sp.]
MNLLFCFFLAIGMMVLLSYAARPAAGQTNYRSGPATLVIVSSPGSPRSTEEIVREINDPATGDRWLLKRDAEHPAGPGRMVLVARKNAVPKQANSSVENAGVGFETGAPATLIHAGDRLVVEEHTRLIDAVLEAVALAPAAQGGALRVRLSIGGRVVKAVAIAPGRALLSPELGEQP